MAQDFRGTNRFELLERVGAGGAGLVYLAHDHKRGTNVALKTLHRESPYGILRLKNEFRGLAEVAHPNLAKLHDLHHDADTWFFTMEFIDGVDFIEWVRPFDSQQIWREDDSERLRNALEQLVLGVSALHLAGHLHRDIKPSNLLVESDGRVVILDFGLATRYDQIDVRDIRGFSGTLEYMAPEQTDGTDPVPASDLYSVGVILYQALTGELPFVGKPLQVAIAKKQNDGPAPSLKNPMVPPDLDELCVGLLKRKPEERIELEEILALLGIEPDESIMMQRGNHSASNLPRLVGRESQMGALVSALGDVRQGQTVLCSIHGKSGMGKSALIRYFIYPLRRRPDTMILRGRCYEREAVPYNVFDSVFDDLTRQLSARTSPEVEPLIPDNIRALTRLFPVLLNVPEISVAVSEQSQDKDAVHSRQAAFEAARVLLSRIASRWLLVIHIDDVHWGDSDSANLLAELTQLSNAPKALFLFSFHTEEMHGGGFVRPLRLLLSRHAVNFRGREIEVGPIDATQSRALIRQLLDGREFSEQRIEQIIGEAAGSPFFLESLVTHSLDDQTASASRRVLSTGALTLDAVITARLALLAPESLRLLQVIVVAGRPIPRQVALEVSKLGNRGEVALGVLRAEHFVRVRVFEEDEFLETYHDRVRDAVQRGMASSVSNHLNRAIALSLERRQQDAPEVFVDHFVQAGELDRARQYLVESASRARGKLAFGRAARLFEQALEIHRQSVTLPASDGALNDERELLIHLGDSLEESGRTHQAAQMFLEAAAGAPSPMERSLLCRAASNLLMSGSIGQGLSLLKRVLDQLNIPYSSSAREALPRLQTLRGTLEERGMAFTLTRSTLDPAVAERIDVCWTAAVGLAMVDYVRGAEFQARCLLESLDSGDAYRIARSLALESVNAAAKAPLSMQRAGELSTSAHRLSTEIDHPHAVGLSLYSRGVVNLLSGQWGASKVSLEAAIQVFRDRCQQAIWERTNAHVMLLTAHAMAGNLDVLAARVPELLQVAQANRNIYFANFLSSGFPALAWLALDEPETGERLQKETEQSLSDQDFQLTHFFSLMSQVHLDLYLGSASSTYGEICAQIPRLQSALIDQVSFVKMSLHSLRARASLFAMGTSGHQPELMESFQVDLEALANGGADWSLAQSRFFQAQAALIRGLTQDATRYAQEALALFDDAETRGWSAAAKIVLGKVLCGDEGQRLVDDGIQFMKENGVKNPWKMLRVYAPLTSP